MAGHSQFKNIMHRKGAQDAKRAKIFTKLIREIAVAAKISTDPNVNPRLKTALLSAREANMPKENIERAINRGAGNHDDTHYHEMRYEGFGPYGVAIIVEALTDNKNRTAAEVRSIFSKYSGALGESNSVSFLFDHVGVLTYKCDPVKSEDAVLEAVIDFDIQDCQHNEQGDVQLICSITDFAKIRDVLGQKFGDPVSNGLMWVAKNMADLDAEQLHTVEKLIAALEDNEDVQSVWSNCNFNMDVDAE